MNLTQHFYLFAITNSNLNGFLFFIYKYIKNIKYKILREEFL